MHDYRVAIAMIGAPLTPHLFLPNIIIAYNYRHKPPRFGQAITIAVGHDRDCYVQFEYTCKQLYHVEKFFKINIGSCPTKLFGEIEPTLLILYYFHSDSTCTTFSCRLPTMVKSVWSYHHPITFLKFCVCKNCKLPRLLFYNWRDDIKYD